MIKRTCSFVSGVLVGALLFGTVAFASTAINVDFIPMKFVFDGVSKALPEGQAGFIYQGRTYVPLRFVSESVGKEVSWDSATQTAFIGKQPATQAPQATSDLETYSNSTDNYSIQVPKGMQFTSIPNGYGGNGVAGSNMDNGLYMIKMFKLNSTDASATADSAMEMAINTMKNSSTIHYISSEKISVAGSPALHFTYSQSVENATLYLEEYLVYTKKGMFDINFITQSQQSGDVLGKTQKIITSFTPN